MDKPPIMDEEDETNYWKDLVHEMCERMDTNALNFYKMKSIGMEIISKHAQHNIDCILLPCTCGLHSMIEEFKSIK